jgi:hypothetical protein
VHESRDHPFEGVKLTRRLMRFESRPRRTTIYNRDPRRDPRLSDLVRFRRVLVQDFAQAVVNIKGLAEILAANDRRTSSKPDGGAESGRSVVGAYLIDAEGETSSARRRRRRALPTCSSSSRFARGRDRGAGLAPHGAGAGGPERDRRHRRPWFYSRVKSRQNTELEPA